VYVLPNDSERARNHRPSVIPNGSLCPEAQALIRYRSQFTIFSIKACIGNPVLILAFFVVILNLFQDLAFNPEYCFAALAAQ